MFEHHKDVLLPLNKFRLRVARNLLWGCLLIALALAVGMLGYHHFEHMTWIDAFANAAMILSGMGPLKNLATEGGKIFAGCYALFSGLAFIVIVGVIFLPVVHRFMHTFHLQMNKESGD